MVQQIEITLKPKRRGFHLVTSEIVSQLPKLPKTGIVNIFTKHTSCGLSINENCDPDVRVDMETIFNRLVPENRPEYEHTLEARQVHAERCQHHHSHYRWPIEPRHLARDILLRVPQLRRFQRVGSNNYWRMRYGYYIQRHPRIQERGRPLNGLRSLPDIFSL